MKTGEGKILAFRDFYVDIDLKIVLSHQKIKKVAQVPNHAWHGGRKICLLPGISPSASEWEESPTSQSLANAIAMNRRELAQYF